MAVMCLQATGDIAALEKKMEMFDQQLKLCNTHNTEELWRDIEKLWYETEEIGVRTFFV